MTKDKIEDLSLEELKKRKKSSFLLAIISIIIFSAGLVITLLRYFGIGYWGESTTLLPTLLIFIIIIMVVLSLRKTNKEIQKRENL